MKLLKRDALPLYCQWWFIGVIALGGFISLTGLYAFRLLWIAALGLLSYRIIHHCNLHHSNAVTSSVVDEDTVPLSSPALIPEEDKPYYRPDSYYAKDSFHIQPLISYEERKEISYPSKRGLYVAQILLLQLCSYGTYPHPKNGYPGYWWITYGIRDVGHALRQLERMGYIEWATPYETLQKMTISQLKPILDEYHLSQTGKKAALIERIRSNIPEAELESRVCNRKYKLTELGRQELADNQYIPYMHTCKIKSLECGGEYEFTVWEINRQLHGNTSNWEAVVAAQKAKYERHLNCSSQILYQHLEDANDPILQDLRRQDKQLHSIQTAEAEYKVNHDMEKLISFWENLWATEGLTFSGSYWAFRLTDLYIQQHRYPDALASLSLLTDPVYDAKVEQYKKKIQSAQN